MAEQMIRELNDIQDKARCLSEQIQKCIIQGQQQQQMPMQQQQMQQFQGQSRGKMLGNPCAPQQQATRNSCCPPLLQQPPRQQQQQCPPKYQDPCAQQETEEDFNQEQNVNVTEVAENGSYIKINNNGSKMEYISGYFVVQTQKDYCLAIYKIPSCVYIAGQSCIKIWTCQSADDPNKLPSDLVFRELIRWKSGPDVTTTLYRCDGKPVSTYKVSCENG